MTLEEHLPATIFGAPASATAGHVGKSKVVLCQPGFMIRSVADFIDAVIELVDLNVLLATYAFQ